MDHLADSIAGVGSSRADDAAARDPHPHAHTEVFVLLLLPVDVTDTHSVHLQEVVGLRAELSRAAKSRSAVGAELVVDQLGKTSSDVVE